MSVASRASGEKELARARGGAASTARGQREHRAAAARRARGVFKAKPGDRAARDDSQHTESVAKHQDSPQPLRKPAIAALNGHAVGVGITCPG